ncbi:hypothetical protein BJV77DRAFT_984029 [Russula vinacea]|nr:hypothetical protein BJV77DRAFT_984029 [Russula vinacea]
MPFTGSDICKILFVVPCPFLFIFIINLHAVARLAIFIPPLGVFLERGCHADFFINILLVCVSVFVLRDISDF